MRFLIGIIGIAFSYALVRYREPIGDAVGQPDWAGKLGGIYNVLILVGIVMFFSSIAYMVGTFDVVFHSVRGLQ